MDSHYDNQILQQSSMRGGVYGGPARQFGSGGGIGAFAMRMGRVAMPLVKKYVVPVAKELGKNLFTSIVPELVSSTSASRKRPRTVLKESFKKSVNKTLTNMTASPAAGGRRTGRGERTGRSRGGGRTTGLRAAQVHAKGSGVGRPGRVGGGQAKSPAAANDVVISRRNTAKRSRSDILSTVNFDN